MKKITLCCILLSGCIQYGFAQDVATEAKKERSHDHSVGVQLNGLIRQVINFNNNTSTTPVNPYLFMYSVNSKRTGWGLRAGLGYNYSSAYNNDGISESTSKTNDARIRLGIEKRWNLTERWSAGAGLDGLVNYSDNNSTTTIRSFDTTITKIKGKVPSFGGGAMAWLRYSINKRIQIGTESSFYYASGKEERETTIIRKRNSFSSPNNSSSTFEKTSPKFSMATFSSPIVFFLIVKI